MVGNLAGMELYDNQIESDENLNVISFLEKEEIFTALFGELRAG
jgi:hypothetical protein